MSLFPYPPSGVTYPPSAGATPANQPMQSADLASSLITYMWSRYVPAFKARGFDRMAKLDVSDTIASTGYAAKVTVANVFPSNLLADGTGVPANGGNAAGLGAGSRVLTDLPPSVATVTLSQDRYVAFSLTQLVEAFISGQATLPAIVDGAISGLINDYQEDIVATIVANAPVSVGTYGVACTETTFIAAVNALIANYMPQETFYALLAPTAGAFGALAQVDRVTWANIRRNGSGFDEKSMVVNPADSFDQLIAYNGGLWSNSQLVLAPTVSGGIYSSNIAWHPAAIAVANRNMVIPTLGTGAIARNMTDAKSGAAVQMLQQWNLTTQSEEMVIKTLYGMSPAQAQWSCLIKGA